MKRMKLQMIAAGLVLALSLVATPGMAALVTSLPGGTVIPMPAIEYFGAGPQTFGPSNFVTWSSTNASNQGGSVFGYTGGYGFGGNGYWDSSLVMAGVNSAYIFYSVSDTMTFAFASPVSSVGGFLNYYPDGITTPTVIAVYDSAMNLIESANLSFSTGGGTNTGQFYGFAENSAIISYFTLTDNYIGITDLTVNGAPVPVPASLLLLAPGLAGLAAIRRRLTK